MKISGYEYVLCMEIEKLFKALSDPTRVRVLLLLSQKKLCVCQLQKILKLPQSKLSKHLGKLRDLNLVVGYQDGKFIKYELSKNYFLENILVLVKESKNLDEQFQVDLSRIDKFDYLIGDVQ